MISRARNTHIRPKTSRGLLVLVLGYLFCAPASAGDWSVLINGKAVHINPSEGSNLNENNWGVGFQYDFDQLDGRWVPFITASGFDDSNRNASYYAGAGTLRRFELTAQREGLHVDAGVIVFFMTREGYRGGDPFLGLLPAFSVGTERLAINLTYVPKIEAKMVPLVFFQLKVSLKTFLPDGP